MQSDVLMFRVSAIPGNLQSVVGKCWNASVSFIGARHFAICGLNWMYKRLEEYLRQHLITDFLSRRLIMICSEFQ